MNRIVQAVQSVKGFLAEVGAEAKKSTWPERQELAESTVVVIVSVLILSAFIGLCDQLILNILRIITP